MSQGRKMLTKNAPQLVRDFHREYSLHFRSIICGSVRRDTLWCNDIDLVLVVPLFKRRGLEEDMKRIWGIQKTQDKPLMRGDFRGIAFDLHLTPEHMLGAMLLHATGPWTFNKKLRMIAKQKGLKLNQYGLWKGERCIASETEEEILHHLGQKFIEPRVRSIW